jgi:L-ascorbate metabolism protein UlaG (beta-lactamase superfamily)
VDAVLISHDHYDHLDYPTLTLIKDWAATFIVPLGVGAHLESWGVADGKIVELDWWEAFALGDLQVVATPARHSSGRNPLFRDRTLWAGFALIGPKHRIFFSGDTGMFPGMEEIGARFGPFDLTMIEVGTYAQSWADWHLGPEQAVDAHLILGGSALLPIHWGLFNLSTHAWTEPMERVLVAAEDRGVTVLGPRPGESVEPSHPPELRRWWPDLPWRTAEAYPVVSSGLAGR